MNARDTWLWVLAAAGLFAFVYLVHPPGSGARRAPPRVLPEIQPEAVTRVQIQPLGIEVERVDGAWRMNRPLPYPAQTDGIERLLACLKELAPAVLIAEAELATNRANAEETFGFAAPQAAIQLRQDRATLELKVGKRTLPGNQVYLRAGGGSTIFVTDADWLKLLPKSANDWRDSALITLTNPALDCLAVTNGPNVFVLVRDPTNQLWRMTYPTSARADSDKIELCLQQLRGVRVCQFVSDEPRTDLDALGLNPPEVELALGQGTNLLDRLQFGKSPTNDATLAYARHADRATVLTVPKTALALWKGTANEFRDPRLVSRPSGIESVEVFGRDRFTLQSQADGSWRLVGAAFPLDADTAKEFVSNLSGLRVAQFEKDLVLEKALSKYGLDQPVLRYLIRFAPSLGAGPSATNAAVVELQFGAVNEDRVYARRKDETSVYAVALTNVQALPDASWQLRRRQLWSFDTNAIAGLTIRQQGRVRQLIHQGHYQWSFAPGSQGVIDNLVVEETARELGRVSAVEWVSGGAPERARYGLTNGCDQITLDLKDGRKAVVEFGARSPAGGVYAGTTFEGEPWVFEFPAWLYSYVTNNLWGATAK